MLVAGGGALLRAMPRWAGTRAAGFGNRQDWTVNLHCGGGVIFRYSAAVLSKAAWRAQNGGQGDLRRPSHVAEISDEFGKWIFADWRRAVAIEHFERVPEASRTGNFKPLSERWPSQCGVSIALRSRRNVAVRYWRR